MTDYEELYDDLLDEFYELKAENKGLISEFLNDIKYRWNKIVEKLTEISEKSGLKAEFYFPINDNFGELQEKWEAKLKE